MSFYLIMATRHLRGPVANSNVDLSPFNGLADGQLGGIEGAFYRPSLTLRRLYEAPYGLAGERAGNCGQARRSVGRNTGH